MQPFKNFLETILQSISGTQLTAVQSIFIVGVLWLLWILILKLTVRRIRDSHTRYIWRQILYYSTIALGIILLSRLWFSGIQSILTFLGIVSAGIIIVLKEPLQNLFAWVIIIWRELFSLGDRIEVGDHAGDVIDMGIFYFTLMEIGKWVDADQSTGRLLKIPNGLVLNNAVANYSRGLRYIWHEIPILITGESDWKKAKDLLQKIAEQHAETLNKAQKKAFRKTTEEYIISPTLTPTVYTSIKEHGILLTVRYLCEPRHRRNIEAIIYEHILEKFSHFPNIHLAFKDD